jgi:hypothetical protein
MNNQKRILEIFIYVLLLIAGLFSYFADVDIGLHKEIEPQNQEGIKDYNPAVPSDLINYDFEFKGD